MRTDWIVIGVVVLAVLGAFSQGTGESTQPVMNDIDHSPVHGISIAEPAPSAKQSYISPPASKVKMLYYKGYPCTVDCSGHKAGYQWAMKNDVDDPDDCDGNSNSFIEGCRSYGEELRLDGNADESPDDEETDENLE